MSRTLMVMAGGTGGHVFPGLAVAERLRGEGWNVVWLGTRTGMESVLVPKHGIPMEWLTIAGLRGKGLLRKLLMPLMILAALGQSIRAIFRHRPDVVLGMGGFAAFPGGLAAVLLGKPLAVHEQNSIAGLTNRVLATMADRVMVAFPDPFAARMKDEGGRRKGGISSFIPHPSSLEFVGNPVRPEIAALPAPEERFAGRQGPLRLLVVGGSLGALVLNETLPRALALLPEEERPQVVHQTGRNQDEKTRALYAELGVTADVRPFVDDMAAEYARCDAVLCRAGALTVAELAAAGVAGMLVPLPHAVDDHQTWNARFLADAGAALLLPQRELTAEGLAEQLKQLNRDGLLAMARAARSLGKPDATERAARACAALAG